MTVGAPFHLLFGLYCLVSVTLNGFDVLVPELDPRINQQLLPPPAPHYDLLEGAGKSFTRPLDKHLRSFSRRVDAPSAAYRGRPALIAMGIFFRPVSRPRVRLSRQRGSRRSSSSLGAKTEPPRHAHETIEEISELEKGARGGGTIL